MNVVKCRGYDCKEKERCLRYKSKPEQHRQSWFPSDPTKDGKCGYFIDEKSYG
jgi:hypothetical protein